MPEITLTDAEAQDILNRLMQLPTTVGAYQQTAHVLKGIEDIFQRKFAALEQAMPEELKPMDASANGSKPVKAKL